MEESDELKELKVRAYDLAVSIQKSQIELQRINQEIFKITTGDKNGIETEE